MELADDVAEEARKEEDLKPKDAQEEVAPAKPSEPVPVIPGVYRAFTVTAFHHFLGFCPKWSTGVPPNAHFSNARILSHFPCGWNFRQVGGKPSTFPVLTNTKMKYYLKIIFAHSYATMGTEFCFFPGFVPFVLHTLKKKVHTMSPVRFWILNIASAFVSFGTECNWKDWLNLF